jgi:hypothetical protein
VLAYIDYEIIGEDEYAIQVKMERAQKLHKHSVLWDTIPGTFL